MVSAQPLDKLYDISFSYKFARWSKTLTSIKRSPEPNVGLVPMYAIASDALPSQAARAA